MNPVTNRACIGGMLSIKNEVYRWDVVIVTVVGLRLGLTPSLTVPIKNDVYRWDVVIVTWSDYG